ncbi:hypothetical protein AB0C28_07075 [Nonomuraea sp. NPDC048892]|uniref:hypothetical protein n=1 Tax=Nonomuraea sp. NPDC048892 TaxID=3154624 RepID=UPI00340FB0EE
MMERGNTGGAGYTYIETGDDQAVAVSFYDARVRAWTGVVQPEYGRPYLHIGTSLAEVTISTTGGGPVTPADVEAARRIARAAATYMDAVCLAYKRQSGNEA